MKKIINNQKGFSLYFFFAFFIIINVIFFGVTKEQLSFIETKKIQMDKNQALLLSESGFHLSLAEIANQEIKATIIIEESKNNGDNLRVKIDPIYSKIYELDIESVYGSSKSRIKAIIQKDEQNKILIVERRIW